MKRKRILSLFAIPLVIAGTAFGWISARNQHAAAATDADIIIHARLEDPRCNNTAYGECVTILKANYYSNNPDAVQMSAEVYRYINGIGRWETLPGGGENKWWNIYGSRGEEIYYRVNAWDSSGATGSTGTQYFVFPTTTGPDTTPIPTNPIIVNNQAINVALGTKDSRGNMQITATSNYGRNIVGYRFFNNGQGGACPSEFDPVSNPGTTVTANYDVSSAGVYTIWFVDDHNEAVGTSFNSTGPQYRVDNNKVKIELGYLTDTGSISATARSLTGRNIVGYRYFNTGSGGSLPSFFNPVANPSPTVTMGFNVPGPGTYTIWFVDEDGNAAGCSFYTAGLQYKADSSKVAIDLGIMDSEGKIAITGRSLVGRNITGYRFFSDGGGSYAPQSYEPVSELGTSVTLQFDISTPGTYTIWFTDEDHMVHGVSFNSFGLAEDKEPVIYDFRAGVNPCTEQGCQVWVHGVANDDNPGGTEIIYIGTDPNNLTATTPEQHYSYYMAQPGDTVYYQYVFTDTGGHQVSSNIESLTVPSGDASNPEDNIIPGSNEEPGNGTNPGDNTDPDPNNGGGSSEEPVSGGSNDGGKESKVSNPNTGVKHFIIAPMIGIGTAAALWWLAKRNYR